MIKTRVRFTGKLSEGLKKYEKQVTEKVIFSGVAAGAKVIYDEVLLNTSPARMGASGSRRAKGRAPGLLHASIYRAYSPEKSPDGVKTYNISWNKAKARHGHLVEFGTSRMPAKPFLRPAFSRMKDAINASKVAMRKRLSG